MMFLWEEINLTIDSQQQTSVRFEEMIEHHTIYLCGENLCAVDLQLAIAILAKK